MWSPDEYLAELYTNTVNSSFDRTVETIPVTVKHKELRRRLATSIGSRPDKDASLQPELLEKFEMDDLCVEKLAYTTYEGMRVPAYALYPKVRQGKLPAVLACHGHGPGHRAALGMNPDDSFADDPGIHNQFAVKLARRGMFVLVPEIIGFGDRRLRARVEEDPSAKDSSCLPIALQLLMCGMTIAGFRVYEAMRALDYLAVREEVDKDRIGTIGFSGGGMVASLTAALDDRIQATVLCGYTNTYQGSILDRPHCIDNYIPGILQHAEQPELIGLIAPRSLFIESGEQDMVFPIGTTKEAIDRLMSIYRSLGVEDKLAYDLFRGSHEISGKQSFDWLLKQLTLT
ncbi:dienelactone hydrolase [Paenibacillus sp. DS2015]|uniref:alpha/beta hydrolase family protein n=1 Tax=Paenibacillus sp. DS2015 TaxID=3373917 RepID=UPI003D1B281F